MAPSAVRRALRDQHDIRAGRRQATSIHTVRSSVHAAAGGAGGNPGRVMRDERQVAGAVFQQTARPVHKRFCVGFHNDPFQRNRAGICGSHT